MDRRRIENRQQRLQAWYAGPILENVWIALASFWPRYMVRRDQIDFTSFETSPQSLPLGFCADRWVQLEKCPVLEHRIFIEDEIVNAGFNAHLCATVAIIPGKAVSGGNRAVDDVAAHPGVRSELKYLCVSNQLGDRRPTRAVRCWTAFPPPNELRDEVRHKLLIFVVKGNWNSEVCGFS